MSLNFDNATIIPLFPITGIQHVVKVTFCACEEDFITLLRFGLWGATPQCPELAFHQHFMRSLMHLQLETQVSVKGFCAAYSFLNKANFLDTVRMKSDFVISTYNGNNRSGLS